MKEGGADPYNIQLVARALCRRADLSAVTGVAFAHGQGCGDVDVCGWSNCRCRWKENASPPVAPKILG